MKREVEVTILDSKYKLKTDVPEGDFNKIIEFLNKKINEIKKSAGTLTTTKLSILAAIYLAADQYFGEKKIDSIIKKISNMEIS